MFLLLLLPLPRDPRVVTAEARLLPEGAARVRAGPVPPLSWAAEPHPAGVAEVVLRVRGGRALGDDHGVGRRPAGGGGHDQKPFFGGRGEVS